MLKSRSSLRQTLFQVEPGKPAIAKGVRAAIATVLPIALVEFTGWTNLVWTALGGFETTLADVGGLYRTKATAMGLVAVGGAVSIFVGTLAGGTPWLAVLLMFLWGFGCSLASIYGNAITTASNLIAAMFLIALGTPGDFAIALQRCVFFLLGAMLAMFLSLVLWPLRPYNPVRKAVANCYEQLSEFMSASCQLASETVAGDVSGNFSLGQKRILVREALANARSALSQTRATRQGANPLGERLLLLVEIADQVFLSTIALAEVMENHRSGQSWQNIRLQVQQAVEQLSASCRTLAVAIPGSSNASSDRYSLDGALDRIKGELNLLKSATSKKQVDYSAWIAVSYTVGILDRLAGYMDAAFNATEDIREGRYRQTSSNGTPAQLLINQSQPALQILRDNLTLDSAVFRHALRVGVTAAVAVIIYSVFGLKEGYWVTLTVVVILKPFIGATFTRSLQRVIGTVVGGVLAAILAAMVHSPLIMAFLLFPLTVATVALQPINYGIFVFFLTPQVVLLDNILEPGNWQLAIDRILDTAIGGVLALVGGYLLWPSREHKRLPDQFAATIEANRVYFQQVLAKYLGREEQASLESAIQQVRLENTNAQASFQRLLSEPHKRQGNVEAMMAFITGNQMFTNATVTLAAHLNVWSGNHQIPGLAKFAQQIEDVMADLAYSVRTGIPPQILPDLEETCKEIAAHLQQLQAARVEELVARQGDTPTRQAVIDDSLVGIEVERIIRIVTILHSAISRMGGAEVGSGQ